MLAIMMGAMVEAVAVLVHYIARPALLQANSWPTANSYAAFILAAVSIALMLALALNSSYLLDRVFPARRLGVLFAAAWATGAAAIVIGLLGDVQLGAYVAVELLPAAMAFVIMGLVCPGLYRRDASDGSASDGSPAAGRDDAAPQPGGSGRGRQRRGGRARR